MGEDQKSPLFSLIKLDCTNPINPSFVNYSYKIKHFPSGFMCNKQECLKNNSNI